MWHIDQQIRIFLMYSTFNGGAGCRKSIGDVAVPGHASLFCIESHIGAGIRTIPIEVHSRTTSNINQHVITVKCAVTVDIKTTGGDKDIHKLGSNLGITVDAYIPMEAILAVPDKAVTSII